MYSTYLLSKSYKHHSLFNLHENVRDLTDNIYCFVDASDIGMKHADTVI